MICHSICAAANSESHILNPMVSFQFCVESGG